MQVKSCTNPKCEQVNPQPVTEFYLNKGKKDGYNSHCKSCWRRYLADNREKRRRKQDEYNRTHREHAKEYYEANKAQVLKRLKEYREANPDKEKQYYEANKERIIEKNINRYKADRKRQHKNMRRWQNENRERVRAQRLRRYREHPEAILAYSHKRRALVAGNGGSYTAEEWQALCDYYGNKCLACGESKPLTVDHVVPVTKGGSSDISNLQPLCITCNKSKGTKIIDYRPNFIG